MKNNDRITTRANIENRIFEDLNNGYVYQTEIFKLLDIKGITIEDIDCAGFDFILDETLGITINRNEEDEEYKDFHIKIVIFLYNSLELGYRDFLMNKKGKN
tara:strand:+ start:54 stop:359 length:306 start_codon:yes stop_codon:yes gene_type:complete